MEKNLRQDLMNAIGHYRELQIDNARAQLKTTQEGLLETLRYTVGANAADGFAMLVDGVLKEHGL